LLPEVLSAMAAPEDRKIVIIERKDDIPPPSGTASGATGEEPKGTIEEITSSVRELAKTLPESIGKLPGSIGAAIQQALASRDLNVTVHLSEEAMRSIEMLVQAGIFATRSEAAAYLIGEGIAARRDLFEQVTEKIIQIEKLKSELRSLTGRP
jgi:Arc/MetJ-type ribon-helix-helix transcriptional regulator